MPAWTAKSKNGPTYRFIAIRELLQQQELPGMEVQLPFPTYHRGEKNYKLHGLVTNRDLAGDKLIWWSRERCGKGEEMHSIMKSDLAGGQFPSAQFGANAAWWQIMVLAYNLHAAMRLLALPGGLKKKRLKAMRFALIDVPARIVEHSRQLFVRLGRGHPALEWLTDMRHAIGALAGSPA